MAARVDEALRAAAAAGSETLRVETMLLIALKHQCYGELAEGKPLLDEVIQIARSINHKPALLGALAWRGNLRFFQTEYSQAEEMETEALGLASELRDGFLLIFCLFNLGLIRGNLGRMSEALQTLNEAIEMAGRNGDHFWVSRLPNCIGWIYRELQDFDRALEHDQHGVEIAREDRVLEAESNSLINIGIDHLQAGRDEKTLPAFREVEAIFQRDAWFRWRYNIRLQAGSAEYWLAQGDLGRAEEYARRLLEVATHHEVRKYMAVAHKLLAQIAIARGDLAEAEAELNATLDQLRSHPVPIVAWKTYAALGRLHSQLRNRQAARDAFAQAAAIINQIAANVHDEKLRVTFLNSTAVREVLAGAGEGPGASL
jgi:tetratricopeptide (TPR) repeat protein